MILHTNTLSPIYTPSPLFLTQTAIESSLIWVQPVGDCSEDSQIGCLTVLYRFILPDLLHVAWNETICTTYCSTSHV